MGSLVKSVAKKPGIVLVTGAYHSHYRSDGDQVRFLTPTTFNLHKEKIMKDYADKHHYRHTPIGLMVMFIVLAYSIVSWIDAGGL